MDPPIRRTAARLLDAVGAAALSASGSAAVLPAVVAGNIDRRVLRPKQTAVVTATVATGDFSRNGNTALALANAACRALAKAIDPDASISIREKSGRR